MAGVGRDIGCGTGGLGKRLEEHGMGCGHAELIGQVGLDQRAGLAFGEACRDVAQRGRERTLNEPVLLGIGRQFAFDQGPGLPASVEGMGQELATGQCIGQGLSDPLSVHERTIPLPIRHPDTAHLESPALDKRRSGAAQGGRLRIAVARRGGGEAVPNSSPNSTK